MTSLLRFGHIFMIFGEPGTLQEIPIVIALLCMIL